MKFHCVVFGIFFLSLAASACLPQKSENVNNQIVDLTATVIENEGESPTMDFIIPKPVSVTQTEGFFQITSSTQIVVPADEPTLQIIANFLADKLRVETKLALPVISQATDKNNITLALDEDSELGREGYQLTITPEAVKISAPEPAGIFYGIQTFRQLLPVRKDSVDQTGDWEVPAGVIRDYPRFEWRGFMLDVSRHFFGIEDIKRYIDLLAYYKMNRLHLHLSDDQGWRIEIKSWPLLANHGGSIEVGGGAGGYYTQEQYKDIVAYAQQQFVIIIPEIDMPSHTNAALSSYADLNCNGVAPKLYTGTEVGFSSLCVDKEITYAFISDVLYELASLTPGPYLHIGGDEAHSTPTEQYIRFIERVQGIVQALGKQMIGWEEIGQTKLLSSSIAQHWHDETAHLAVRQGSKVIASPSSKVYLDMKYDSSTRLGLNWAGYIDLPTAYNWDPATQIPGIGETDIIGVEAALWSETLETAQDVDFLAFPRLLEVAEVGWTPQTDRDWAEYRLRLAAHGTKLEKMNVNFFQSPQVDWK